MKVALGHGASTCSYTDWLGADLIVFFGSNTPNNQPVTTKYLHHAKKHGTEVAVVNPYREPGFESYWVPSIPESAVFGTRLAEHWFEVETGGDLAFLVGVFRALVEADAVDEEFVRSRTAGYEAARDACLAADWDALERESGAPRDRIRAFARLLVERPNTIFVWSMGLTQHAHGVETIKALMNVALARGLFGRPHRGAMPIRGHSGVQGGAEVGCVPAVDPATARRWSELWGFPVPDARGLTASEMVAASARGEIEALWMVGGNFLDTLPDLARNERALARPRLRVHQDIVVSPMMLVDPGPSAEAVLLLPACTRYESPGGGTETSTERRIIFSPEIPGRRIGSAKPEWWVLGEVMARVRPDHADRIRFESAAAIRREIAKAQPLYQGIEGLERKGDHVQWGGGILYADGRFATPDGRAHFSVVRPLGRVRDADRFRVSTRRGKQFNSMVQRDVDPLTGGARDSVLMSPEDAQRMGVTDGDPVRLESDEGTFEGRVKVSPIRAGNLQVHWPEGTALLSGEVVDPVSLEPDFNTEVRVRPLRGRRRV